MLSILLFFFQMGTCYSVRASEIPTDEEMPDFTVFQERFSHMENWALIESMLKSGLRPNQKDRTGLTPLHVAAEAGNAVQCTILLVIGANVNVGADHTGTTPLIFAASNGHTDCVRLLLEANAKVNGTDAWGSTALFKASSYNHKACVETLLDSGADPNQPNKWGALPLQYAAHQGYTDVVKLLVDHGADVSLHIEQTVPFALSAAASRGHFDSLQVLLESGSSTDYSINNNGHNALYHVLNIIPNYTTYSRLFSEAMPQNCVKELIKHGSVITNECLQALPISDFEVSHCILSAFPVSNAKERSALREKCSKAILQGYTNLTEDTLKLLFSIGLYIPPKDVQSLINSLTDKAKVDKYSGSLTSLSQTPRTLMSMCRLKVRSTLKPNVSVTVDKLPVPRLIKDYLALNSVHHYDTIEPVSGN